MVLYKRFFYMAILLSLINFTEITAHSNTELIPDQAIINVEQLHLHILPNFLPVEKVQAMRAWIEEMLPLAYEDFDQRLGICWDDYWIDQSLQLAKVRIDPVRKFVVINGEEVEQFPQSIFSYPAMANMLVQDILPKYFAEVSQHTKLPESMYMQTFILRSILSEDLAQQKQHVRWHQDPSEYNTIADYTLVLMLSDPLDPIEGWKGGELLIKNGLPGEENPALKVTPRFNQAILFNNCFNSHLVTAIKEAKEGSARDIVIINIHLQDPTKKLFTK